MTWGRGCFNVSRPNWFRHKARSQTHKRLIEDSQIGSSQVLLGHGGFFMARFDLSDFEWTVIEPLLPNKPRGVPRVNDRRVLNGIFWRLRTGAPWADIPSRYGPHTTCVNRFNRWRRAGHWDRILRAVSAAYDGDIQMIDSSSIRVHQHAANGKKNRSDPVAWAARAAG
jgi:transposase